MKTSKFLDAQIALAPRQAEARTPVGEPVARSALASERYVGRRNCLGPWALARLRELRRLREENRKVKGLVADLSLEKTILREAPRENGKARRPQEQLRRSDGWHKIATVLRQHTPRTAL